jgi:hypothetical protein
MSDEPEIPTYPEGVGPHEGRELELMLAGKKPLAMFSESVVVPVSDFYPEEEFMVHVKAGTLIRHDETFQLQDLPTAIHAVYYALPSEEWRIKKMHELHLIIAHKVRPWTDDDERTVGRLLGYSDNEVSIFIAWKKQTQRLA